MPCLKWSYELRLLVAPPRRTREVRQQTRSHQLRNRVLKSQSPLTRWSSWTSKMSFGRPALILLVMRSSKLSTLQRKS